MKKRLNIIRGAIGEMETKMLIVPMLGALVFWVLSILMGSSETVNEFDRSVIQWLYATPEAEPFGMGDLRNNARDLTALGSPFLLVIMALGGVLWLIGEIRFDSAFSSPPAGSGSLFASGSSQRWTGCGWWDSATFRATSSDTGVSR